jgi:hypothetical protein
MIPQHTEQQDYPNQETEDWRTLILNTMFNSQPFRTVQPNPKYL